MSFPFCVTGTVVASNPVERFASKKDPSKYFTRWTVLVRLESGHLLSVSDWDPPPALPDFSGSPRVSVAFAEVQRSRDIPGAWLVRGKVSLLQGK